MARSRVSGLEPALAVSDDGIAIVSAIGAVNSGAISLINAALLSKIAVTSSDTSDPASLAKDPSSKSASSTVAPKLYASASSPSGPLVLALEGLDSMHYGVDTTIESDLTLAVALSGIVLLTVRLPDLARPNSSALSALLSSIGRNLALRVAGVAPSIPMRRLLIIAVRDFEEDVVSPTELETALLKQLSDRYAEIEKPAGFAGMDFSDLYEVQFSFLPHDNLFPSQYSVAVLKLGQTLRTANTEYVDAGMTSDRLLEIVDKIGGATELQNDSDLPDEKELASSFACEAVMRSVLDKYSNTSKQWKATVDAGRIIRDFGKESSRLITRTVDVFEKDAAMYKSTRAFARKKEELRSFLLADAYGLYAKQILKLREVAYQVFRGKLARIRINEQVEKNVRGAVKETEVYFVEKAESLRSDLGNWRFDSERHELVNHMRDDATERLQLARLQGNYVPPMRAPIAFAFHTLLLAPFGRDSRFAHPHAEEMQQSFDPDKVKKAGFSRARPHQRNQIFTVSGNDELANDAAEKFDYLFADAPGS